MSKLPRVPPTLCTPQPGGPFGGPTPAPAEGTAARLPCPVQAPPLPPRQPRAPCRPSPSIRPSPSADETISIAPAITDRVEGHYTASHDQGPARRHRRRTGRYQHAVVADHAAESRRSRRGERQRDGRREVAVDDAAAAAAGRIVAQGHDLLADAVEVQCRRRGDLHRRRGGQVPRIGVKRGHLRGLKRCRRRRYRPKIRSTIRRSHIHLGWPSAIRARASGQAA